jgi:hypothetical protein
MTHTPGETMSDTETERTADCAQRYLYELIHDGAFKEVREILRHTSEYMAEHIEYLEERDTQMRLPQVHRQSA